MIGIYARVSTEEQARHGYSIQSQLRLCREKAKAIDPYLEIKEYIDRGISGEFIDRPALKELRKDVKEGIIHKVVCYDPDRFSRKLMNQLIIVEELDKRNIELIFVDGDYSKTPEGQLFFNLRGSISEFEKAKIKERTMRGRREKAAQGKVLRNYEIYGYDYDSEKQKLVINEDEAKIVQLIFDLFTEPNDPVSGINSIAKLLTEKQVSTKKNTGVWHRQVVRQILMNKTYIGEFYQNKWNAEGMLANKTDSEVYVPVSKRPKKEWILIPCPPIINREKFEYAQKLIQESRRRWAKKSRHKYLLSGLVRCGECSNTMTGRKGKNWGRYEYEYTDKKNYSGAKNPGCGQRIKCIDLDTIVWDKVLEWLKDTEKISDAAEKESKSSGVSYEEAELERVEKELKKIEMSKKRMLDLYAQSDEDIMGDVKKTLMELKEKEKNLIIQKNKVEEELADLNQMNHIKNILREAVDYYFNKNPGGLTFEDKQKIIRSIVREVRVFKDRIEIYGL